MNYIIKIHREVMNQIIIHSTKYPTLECGGYLIGNKKKTPEGMIFNVIAIFSDENIGAENRYHFFNSTKEAINNYCKENLKGFSVIGNYHSHGEYQAIFSKEDIEMAETSQNYFCNIIYSPKFHELNGKIHLEKNKIYDATITFFGKDKELLNPIELVQRKK